MIKLDNVKETSETRTEVSRPYLDIKPQEYLSDLELTDLISKEFEDAHNVAEFNDYGSLLSEVFNCSEDEINIDFSVTDEILEIMKCFTPENWASMSNSEKVEAINNLTIEIGRALKLDNIPKVDITNGDDSYGFYNVKNNMVVLNSQFLSNPLELVNTIAHELRHAFQHMRAEKLETREDARYKVNFDNYISPVLLPGGEWLFFTDYYSQYVEVDARAFADKVTEAML